MDALILICTVFVDICVIAGGASAVYTTWINKQHFTSVAVILLLFYFVVRMAQICYDKIDKLKKSKKELEQMRMYKRWAKMSDTGDRYEALKAVAKMRNRCPVGTSDCYNQGDCPHCHRYLETSILYEGEVNRKRGISR